MWPALASKLTTLATLHIQAHGVNVTNGCNTYNMSPKFATAPKSLTKLILNFEGGEHCLTTSQKADWVAITPEAQFVDLKTLFPQLRELEVSGSPALTNTFCSVLPPTLVALKLHQNTMIGDEGISMLPDNLERLILPCAMHVTGSTLAKFKNLATLVLGGGPASALAVSALIKYLPSMVSELELPLNRTMTDADVPFLPKYLSKLVLTSNANITSISALPNTLTELSLATPFTDGMLVQLPPALKSLFLQNGGQLTNESFAHLPRTLTALNIWYCEKITDEAIPLLPQSLTKLLLDAPLLSDACVSNLSPTLLSLDLRRAPFTNKFLRELPCTNLSTLNLSGAQEIDSFGLAVLPIGLRRLSLISAKHVTPDCLQMLPPTLVSMTVLSSAGFQNTPISSLPKNLETLFAADLIHPAYVE